MMIALSLVNLLVKTNLPASCLREHTWLLWKLFLYFIIVKWRLFLFSLKIWQYFCIEPKRNLFTCLKQSLKPITSSGQWDMASTLKQFNSKGSIFYVNISLPVPYLFLKTLFEIIHKFKFKKELLLPINKKFSSKVNYEHAKYCYARLV